jgi:hypothetical protein
MTDKEKTAYRIANNALYFDDNSDYKTALWEVLAALNPGLDYDKELEYIEQEA